MQNGRLNGYLVLYDGEPTWMEWHDSDTKGVLWRGGKKATVFDNRYAAQKAIRKTQSYALANQLPWDGKHTIIQLTRVGQ